MGKEKQKSVNSYLPNKLKGCQPTDSSYKYGCIYKRFSHGRILLILKAPFPKSIMKSNELQEKTKIGLNCSMKATDVNPNALLHECISWHSTCHFYDKAGSFRKFSCQGVKKK